MFQNITPSISIPTLFSVITGDISYPLSVGGSPCKS